MKKELEKYSEKRADEVYDINIDELRDLVKDGAKWMLTELKKDPSMINRELITKYLNELD